MARKYEERKAKPSNDAYTGMLVVSFVALLIGSALLYLDYSQYDPKIPPKMTREVPNRPGPDQGPPKGKETSTEEKELPKDTTPEKDTPPEKKDTPPVN